MNLETQGEFACIWSVCTCSYLAAILVDAGQWPASNHGHFIVLVRGWVEKAIRIDVIENKQIFASPRIEKHFFGLSVRNLVTILTQLPASHNPCAI